MALPYVPEVPTESLHKFCAITGLILVFIPGLYLKNEISETKLAVINLRAESEILKLQVDEFDKEQVRLIKLMYGKELDSIPLNSRKLYSDSIFKSIIKNKKFVAISIDSADSRAKYLKHKLTSNKIASIKFSEKLDSIKSKLDDVKDYIIAAYIFLGVGGFMASFGFSSWYKKENPPKEATSWRRKKRFQ